METKISKIRGMVAKTARKEPAYYRVAEGVWGLKTVFVNVYMVALKSQTSKWILIDAGFKGYDKDILAMAKSIFGIGSKPEYILLTHGHLDHVGNLEALLKYWDVPVYAHQMELPYLMGKSSYPPADPTVGGGIMSMLSFMFSPKPIDISFRVQALADDGTVPGFPEWQYIPTPGHSPGHVSFWRKEDRLLIVGDAFVTTQQESAYSVITQEERLCGPPKYFTMNWHDAQESVTRLAALDPRIAASGHGRPMRGDELYRQLQQLEDHFYQIAIPKHGRYINDPARADKNGVYFIPPLDSKYIALVGLTVAVSAASAIIFTKLVNKAMHRNNSTWEKLANKIG